MSMRQILLSHFGLFVKKNLMFWVLLTITETVWKFNCFLLQLSACVSVCKEKRQSWDKKRDKRVAPPLLLLLFSLTVKTSCSVWREERRTSLNSTGLLWETDETVWIMYKSYKGLLLWLCIFDQTCFFFFFFAGQREHAALNMQYVCSYEHTHVYTFNHRDYNDNIYSDLILTVKRNSSLCSIFF